MPAPGVGEVVIRVRSVGICASDLKCCQGAPLFWGDEQRQGYCQAPIIPGHEFAGEVVALGEGVEGDQYGLRLVDLAVSEQIVPCGNCRYCLRGQYWMCMVHDIYGFRQRTFGAMAEFVKFPAGALNCKVPDNCLDVDIHLRSGLGAQLDGNRVVVDEVLPARRYLSRPIFKGQDPRTSFDLTIPGNSISLPRGFYRLSVEPGQSREDGVGTRIFISCEAMVLTDLFVELRREGLVVAVLGEGLDEVERVELGGSEAKFDIASDTELTVFVPEGVSGEQILVVHGGGQAVKQVVSIKAAERGARLEGLEIVERTRSGYVMRLTGTQFTRDMVEGLRVGGARVEKVDFISSEEITLVVPATLIPKSGEVSISLVDKTGEISRNFTLEK